jgi:hypothetical protein
LLPQLAAEALREHRKRQAADRLTAEALWQDHGLVFASAVGTQLDRYNVRREFDVAAGLAVRPRSATSPFCARIDYRPRLGNDPARPMSEEAAMTELDRLEAAVGECREMIREAHAATKDLRAAVREAKKELHDLAKDEIAAHIQREVSRQLEELGEQTSAAVQAATQKVIAEFDRFGESLLGKETYWQTASGRRSVNRPDPDVVTLDTHPGEDEG